MTPHIDSDRLLFPKLGIVYNLANPYLWTIFRILLGVWLIPHGFPKLFGDDAIPASKNFVNFGWDYPIVWAYFIGCLEFFGGIFLILGLGTRLVALMVAVQMFVISFAVLYPTWGWGKKGMEFALLWGLLCLILVIKGGGKYSADRFLPKEL